MSRPPPEHDGLSNAVSAQAAASYSGIDYTKATAISPTTASLGLKAMWLHFAHDAELRRLAKLYVRIELKRANLSDFIHERQTIMNRCIRRMRRSAGKN